MSRYDGISPDDPRYDPRFDLDLPPIARMWGRDCVRDVRDALDRLGYGDGQDQGDDQS